MNRDNDRGCPFEIVVAADLKGGIGKDQTLPWKLPGDMNYFKTLTSQTKDSAKLNAVIMGRKTWESIPLKFRPLKSRFNIVITTNSSYQLPDGVALAGSFDQALQIAGRQDVESVFVIGGGSIYSEALNNSQCRHLYLTQVNAVFDCDTFLGDWQESFEEVSATPEVEENGIKYCFKTLMRR